MSWTSYHRSTEDYLQKSINRLSTQNLFLCVIKVEEVDGEKEISSLSEARMYRGSHPMSPEELNIPAFRTWAPASGKPGWCGAGHPWLSFAAGSPITTEERLTSRQWYFCVLLITSLKSMGSAELWEEFCLLANA